MGERVSIGDLMERSGVKFGTSGARGLVRDMTDEVCYAYTLGFLQYLRDSGDYPAGGRVALAGDLRPSSPRILAAVAAAVSDFGHTVVNCGAVPTPALANYGIANGIPSIMVTGSHIPDDRNGIKFNKPTGEILKADEEAIRAQRVEVDPNRFTGGISTLAEVHPDAGRAYVERYTAFFPRNALAGARVGVYEHSSVARDLLAETLRALGAEVVRLDRTDTFVPVDTEAIRPEDVEKARQWCSDGGFDSVISADGDGDRPLVSDETGEWLRGDVAGVLCARYLGARAVATPVSCNTVVEASGWFDRVVRTRIGSPYVIEGMEQACADGFEPVVGYEANGGFLTATPIRGDGKVLPPLPTRDAAIVAVAILVLSRESRMKISELVKTLPGRYTYSDRLKEFPTRISHAKLAELSGPTPEEAQKRVSTLFREQFGPVRDVNTTDGLRITFADGRIAHLRASGNAPELRCYSEAESPEDARRMAEACLGIAEQWRS